MWEICQPPNGCNPQGMLIGVLPEKEAHRRMGKSRLGFPKELAESAKKNPNSRAAAYQRAISKFP